MPISPPAAGGEAAVRGRRLWEFAFIGVLVATCVAVTVADGPDPIAKGIGAVLLLCQVPLYVLLGRATVMFNAPRPERIRYLALVVVLFLPATVLAPVAALALFALAPLSYMVVHPGLASAAVAILNSGPIASIVLAKDSTWQDTTLGVAAIAMGVLLSFTFGMWIHRVVQQSHERAGLIRRLDATRAELAEVSRHAGVLEERRRMAREIHDTLAQGFSGIVMLLRAAEAEPDQEGHYLRLALRAAQNNLDDARALVSGSLDTVGLPESLRRLAECSGDELGIAVGFGVTGDERRLSPHVEIALLRVAQEALANVRKHAAADRVTLELEFTAEALRLQLRDNGSGFDIHAVHDGHGLPGMLERVQQLGGTVDIASAAGDGTTVTVEVSA